MVWMGPSKFFWVHAPTAPISPVLQVAHHFVENADGLLAAVPFGLGAQQVFLGHHLQDGPDVLRHAAVHQHQALLQFLARRLRNPVGGEDLVIGQQASAADAELRIALARLHAVDQLDAGPDAAGILPAAAAAAEPFAEDGARRHQAAVVFLERAGERVDLVGGAHAHRDQAGQQIGGDGEARALRNVVHLADDFDAVAGLAGEPREQVGERLGGALHARRHDAAGDHGGLQQAEIVAREIEDFGDGGDVGRGAADPRW